MATPPVCDFGWQAPAFSLPGTDGGTHTLRSVSGTHGTLVMFICNHCPYVLRQLDRIVADAKALQAEGIGVAAICSNDATRYPGDSFPKMIELAEDQGFPFPYLHDESQEVARAWDAACTPDFFGLAADGTLQYRGQLTGQDGERALLEAMKMIAETGQGPRQQVPSRGCSIKWRAA
ncbi:MAG: thioredoxin family protein [Pseudomonadota bacterium]